MRVVDELVADVDAGAGDLPVAMAAGEALLVEVEVVGVAGISGVAGPNLQACAGVAGEDGSGEAFIVGAVDVIGLVEVARWAEGGLQGVARDGAVGRVVGRRAALALFDEVGVDEEVVEAGFGERLLDADAFESRLRVGGAGGGGGGIPEACGPIAALRRPDAARTFAK